jgi:PPP family 3-phenylpropionic acid transporter
MRRRRRSRPRRSYVLLGAAIAAWTPYSSVYFQSLGISLSGIGLLAAVGAGVAIVAAPAWGTVADRLGDVRPPILAAASSGALVAAWLATGPTGLVLVLAVALLSCGTAALGPLLDARTVQRLGRDRDRYGQARAWASISFIVASIAVGALIAATSPRASPILYAPLLAATGAAGALLLGRARRSARVASLGPAGAWRLLRIPGLGLFFAGSVGSGPLGRGRHVLSLRLIDLGRTAGSLASRGR